MINALWPFALVLAFAMAGLLRRCVGVVLCDQGRKRFLRGGGGSKGGEGKLEMAMLVLDTAKAMVSALRSRAAMEREAAMLDIATRLAREAAQRAAEEQLTARRSGCRCCPRVFQGSCNCRLLRRIRVVPDCSDPSLFGTVLRACSSHSSQVPMGVAAARVPLSATSRSSSHSCRLLP